MKLKSSGEMAVVKFVARYGAEAHQLPAGASMAPRRIFCSTVDSRDDVRNASRGSVKDGCIRLAPGSTVHGRHGVRRWDTRGWR